jgi:hypothetical protein
MDRPLSFKIMLSLALIQAVGGMLRAFNWVRVGVDLFEQGLLLLPMLGVVAVMRGLLISVVALLYVLFVVGAMLQRSWAWVPCLIAAIVNLLLVLSALIQGSPLVQIIAWALIPAVLLWYIFSPTGRAALKFS